MSKNLVFIHLESISNTILWQYRVELRTVWQMMQRSMVYKRFYSAATSTEMSLETLNYGDSSIFDASTYFRQKDEFTRTAGFFNKAMTLWQALFFEGYYNPCNLYSVWEIADKPELTGDSAAITAPNQEDWYPLVRAGMAQHKIDGKPFIFSFVSGITHITYEDRIKKTATSFSDRFRLGYLRLDSGINKLLSILQELKIMDNTVIVFYGDHGDELWSHGLNGGWCHATTPYASQCWTPLFIYDADCPAGSTDQLASMVDLRETLVKRMVPNFDPAAYQLNDEWTNRFGVRYSRNELAAGIPRTGTLPPFKSTPFCGIDLASETRELAFSQDLYALQMEFNDSAKALTKGYAVTDGVYRVTVTSGGSDPRDGGLEFFCDIVDPTNSRNLLNFFRLDSNGDIKEFYPPAEAVGAEFSLAFNHETVKHLTETYQKLKKALYEYIRDKEEFAKPKGRGQLHVMPESAFKHSMKRSFKN